MFQSVITRMIISKTGILILILAIVLSSNAESIQWNKLIEKTHDWSNEYSKELREKLHFISESKNISSACNSSIWQTVNGIQNLELWAIDMINSWGSFPPSGVRTGTSTDFGSFDQCMAIEPNSIIDKPQYCLVSWKPPIPRPMPVHHNIHHRIDVLPKNFTKNLNKNFQNVFESYSEFASFFYWLSLRTGICTPSHCSTEDISILGKEFANSYGLQLDKINCQTKPTETKISTIQIIAILFLLCVLVLSLMASLSESFWTEKVKVGEKPTIIELFSIKQNIKLLFDKRGSETLPCIHGIRVLSMVWIVFGHTTEWMDYKLFSRSFVVKELFSRIDVQIAYSAFYAVETFFFIGGLLSSYVTLQLTGGQISRFNTIAFLGGRFLRLTLQVLIFILLTFLIPLAPFATGPIWNETFTPVLERCSKNWWWDLLYIQNFLGRYEICAEHTWYLACDMQLHWLSLVFMIPLLYNLKFGFLITSATIPLFYASMIGIAYWLNIPPGILKTGLDENFWLNYFSRFYHKPWSHTSVFFLGFLMGVIAYKRMFIKLNMIPKYLIQFLMIVGFSLCVMDTYYWNEGSAFNRLLSSFILATSRLIWSVSLAALIWLCISGNGGIFNTFLSAHIFTPFSRLTYSAYLTHAWILWAFIGTRRERMDTNIRDMFLVFVHNLVLAYVIAFIFGLLFETPILRLLTLLMKKIHKPTDIKNDIEVNTKLNDNNNNVNNDNIELQI